MLPEPALVEADEAHLLTAVERAVEEDRRDVDAAHAVNAMHVSKTLLGYKPSNTHIKVM